MKLEKGHCSFIKLGDTERELEIHFDSAMYPGKLVILSVKDYIDSKDHTIIYEDLLCIVNNEKEPSLAEISSQMDEFAEKMSIQKEKNKQFTVETIMDQCQRLIHECGFKIKEDIIKSLRSDENPIIIDLIKQVKAEFIAEIRCNKPIPEPVLSVKKIKRKAAKKARNKVIDEVMVHIEFDAGTMQIGPKDKLKKLILGLKEK